MLIQLSDAGLYCPAGDFHIDPWKPVKRAVITHAHADHARRGSQRYFASSSSAPLLRKRLGTEIELRSLPFGARFSLGRATVSLHPAGHILGSAQVRVEADGEVWVASGDYKREPDPTCEPFEVVSCDTFITEATFALPIYRWPPIQDTVAAIHGWWMRNRKQQRASVLFSYSLGKAQRVLAELLHHTEEAVLLHGAAQPLVDLYRQQGVPMVPTSPAIDPSRKRTARDYAGELIIAPPGANGTPWMRRFGKCSTAFCSGWMQIRGNRRRRGHDQGFVLSDHADWPALLRTIEETGARQVVATHGQSEALVRYLRQRGLAAGSIRAPYGEDEMDELGEASS